MERYEGGYLTVYTKLRKTKYYAKLNFKELCKLIITFEGIVGNMDKDHPYQTKWVYNLSNLKRIRENRVAYAELKR